MSAGSGRPGPATRSGVWLHTVTTRQSRGMRYPPYGRLDQRQRPTVDYADEAIRADLARGQGLLDMR